MMHWNPDPPPASRRPPFVAGRLGPTETRLRQVRVHGTCRCGRPGDRCHREPHALCTMCRAEEERLTVR